MPYDRIFLKDTIFTVLILQEMRGESMEKINFAVIGMGNRGSVIAKYLKERKEHINLAAICDNDDIRLESWKDSGVRIYKDYKEVLANKEINSVFIATPDYTHEEVAIAAINSNKHIICEKPLEITEEKIAKILEAAKNKDKIFMLGYVLRYAPLFKKIKEIAASGLIGRVLVADVTDNINYGGFSYFHDWHREERFATSLLLQKSSHSLDIVSWVLDSRPMYTAAFGGLNVFGSEGAKRVFSKTVGNDLCCSECSYRYDCEESIENVYRIKGIARRDIWPDSCVYSDVVDVDDNQVVIVQYENGARASYTLCQFTPEYKRQFLFIGDKGRLEADDKSNTITITFRNSKEVQKITVSGEGGHGGGDEGLIEDFIQCYYNNRKPVASIEEGAISALLTLAAQESINERNIIRVKSI